MYVPKAAAELTSGGCVEKQVLVLGTSDDVLVISYESVDGVLVGTHASIGDHQLQGVCEQLAVVAREWSLS